MRRVLSNECGMTLAEVLVALPIITIGLLALLSAIPLSTYATQEGRQTSTATFLANERLEQVRNAEWSARCAGPAGGPVTVGPAIVTDHLGVSSPPNVPPTDPASVATFADEASLPAPYAPYSRQVRITETFPSAPTCNAAGEMTGAGARQATVTVTYTPLSATGKNAISGTRSVTVTMQISQREK